MAEAKQPAKTPHNGAALPFGQDAAQVLGELQSAMLSLVQGASPVEVRRAADVERALGVDRKLCWQVYRIATASNPLAAGTNVPARVSVERLLKVAERRRVSPITIAGVSRAFERFERLVAQHADSREEFDALIAAALPDEHDKMSFASREAIYHAARNIRGVTMQTGLISQILYPSKHAPDMLDVANMIGYLGLRRIRRGAPIECTALVVGNANPAVQTVDGRPVTDTADIMLEEFCSVPTPTMAPHPGGEQMRFTLEGEDVGTQAAVDSVFARVMPAFRSRYATPERATTGLAHATDAPSRWQVIDLLYFEGVLPAQDPEARVYDVIPHGVIRRYPDPTRDIDRVVFDPSVRYMGRGLESFRCSHAPRYMDMIQHICSKRGWDASRLHGYRVEIEYPVYSWQTVLALRLPNAPEQSATG